MSQDDIKNEEYILVLKKLDEFGEELKSFRDAFTSYQNKVRRIIVNIGEDKNDP